MFSFISSKPLIQPYLQFWRLILKINVCTVSANATVCTWKVMTCMADSGTWYCLLSGRAYGTSRECSLSLKFRLCQKLDSLGFQLQKWRILTSKAINGEVSHHTDKYRDIFPRALIGQNIPRGTRAIADSIYNLSDLIGASRQLISHRSETNERSHNFLGCNYSIEAHCVIIMSANHILLAIPHFIIIHNYKRENPFKCNLSSAALANDVCGPLTPGTCVNLAIIAKIGPADNQSDWTI